MIIFKRRQWKGKKSTRKRTKRIQGKIKKKERKRTLSMKNEDEEEKSRRIKNYVVITWFLLWHILVAVIQEKESR